MLEGLFKKAEVTIACNAQDVSQIYGYICHETVEEHLVVHFAYTKETYRRLGIAAMLAEAVGFKREAPVFFTHRTNSAEGLEKKFAMIYNPFLAYYGYEVGK